MTKTQLIAISAIRDLLDFVVIGQIPGLNWILNAPVIWLHYRFAGPRALITLFENVPGIETLPCFTVAAISYPDPHGANPKRIDARVIGSKAGE